MTIAPNTAPMSSCDLLLFKFEGIVAPERNRRTGKKHRPSSLIGEHLNDIRIAPFAFIEYRRAHGTHGNVSVASQRLHCLSNRLGVNEWQIALHVYQQI